MYKIEKRNNMVLGIIISVLVIICGISANFVNFYKFDSLTQYIALLVSNTILVSLGMVSLLTTVSKKEQPDYLVPILFIGYALTYIASPIQQLINAKTGNTNISAKELAVLIAYMIIPTALIIAVYSIIFMFFRKPNIALRITSIIVISVMIVSTIAGMVVLLINAATRTSAIVTFFEIICCVFILLQILNTYKFTKESTPLYSDNQWQFNSAPSKTAQKNSAHPMQYPSVQPVQKQPVQQPAPQPVQPVQAPPIPQPMPVQPQVPVTPPVPQPAPAEPKASGESSTIEQLEKIAAMREKGLLTEEEFTSIKTDLLNK